MIMYADDSIPERLESFAAAVEDGDVEAARRHAEAADEAFTAERSGPESVSVAVAKARSARDKLGVPGTSRTADVDEAARERRRRLTEFLQRQGTVGSQRAEFLTRAWGYVVSDGERTDGLLETTESLVETERSRIEASDSARTALSETTVPPEVRLLERSLDDPVPTGGGSATVTVANVGDDAVEELSSTASVDDADAAVDEAPDALDAEATGEVVVSLITDEPGSYPVRLAFEPQDGVASSGTVVVPVETDATGEEGETDRSDTGEGAADGGGTDDEAEDAGASAADTTSGRQDTVADVEDGSDPGDGDEGGDGGIGVEEAVGVGAGLSALLGGGYLYARRSGGESDGPDTEE